jgi:hypothetical protein
MLEEKVKKFEGLTPFEEEHQQQQQQQTSEEWLAKLATRQYLTRGQWWHGYGRRVTVPNAEARKTITTQSGRLLYLFDESQLLPLPPEQEQDN